MDSVNISSEETVAGIAEAYGRELKLSAHGSWDDRPAHVLQRGIEAAMTKWLNDNRVAVLKAIARGKEGEGR